MSLLPLKLRSLIEAKIQTNKVFRHLLDSDSKIIVEQGGARSGKTYNILLWIITVFCNQNSGKVVTVCRKTFPALRATVMRDFIDILKSITSTIQICTTKATQSIGSTIASWSS